jgi:putative transport protein
MDHERALIATPVQGGKKRKAVAFQIDPLGLFPFSLAVLAGILLGSVVIPLPGTGSFSLGITGGPLIAALAVGHIQKIGPVNLSTHKALTDSLKEIGLFFFFAGAGLEGGRGFVAVLQSQGLLLLAMGFVLTMIPMTVGYLVSVKVLRLPLLNGLGSLTASMTSTPALGSLVQIAGTTDVIAPYAATYPIALILLIMVVQFLIFL